MLMCQLKLAKYKISDLSGKLKTAASDWTSIPDWTLEITIFGKNVLHLLKAKLLVQPIVMLNASSSRAVRRRHCVGGGAPVNFGRRRRRAARPKKTAAGGRGGRAQKSRRRRRGVDGPKYFFLRFTKKFRSILKIFLGTFLVIKALRFADDQCYSGQ